MCGEEFEAQRRSRMYCGDVCKQRAWRQANVYNVVSYETDDDLLQLLERAAEKLREGRSPLRELKRIETLSTNASVNAWLARHGRLLK